MGDLKRAKRRNIAAAILRSSAAIAMVVLAGHAQAGQGAVKSAYHLFNPTPRELMREMSTDRPDTTESPYTVDAGHVQIEMSVVDFTRDDDDDSGVRTDQFVFAPMNLKMGLLHNVDVQFVLDPFVRIETDADGGDGSDASGFGSAQLRVKFNVWGNDGGDTALAIMPFVQFPTASNDVGGNDHVEGGLIVPLAVALPGEWSLGLMAEVDVVRDDANEGYGIEFLHTAALGHPIVGDLLGYVEYIGVAPHQTGATYTATVGGGLTYAVSDDVQLDVGLNVGISEGADDFTVFTGLSWRF